MSATELIIGTIIFVICNLASLLLTIPKYDSDLKVSHLSFLVVLDILYVVLVSSVILKCMY